MTPLAAAVRAFLEAWDATGQDDLVELYPQVRGMRQALDAPDEYVGLARIRRRLWAEARAGEGCFWAYSDGWIVVYDSDQRHIMLAELRDEKIGETGWQTAYAAKAAKGEK
jgi:hypothetical protein